MIVASVEARAVARWSALAAVVLILAHTLVSALFLVGMIRERSPLPRIFSLTRELNLPAWFASVQLLVAAAIAGITARRAGAVGDRDATRWTVLAAVLMLQSVDEVVAVHEMVATQITVPGALLALHLDGWFVLGAGIATAFLVYFLPLVSRLPVETRRGLLLSGALYYGGAVVLHAVAIVVGQNGHTSRRLAVATIEEAAELFGVTLLLYVLVRHQEGVARTLPG